MERKREAPSRRFWVLMHHQECSVVEASERPTTKVDAGERQKRVKGPYATKDQAQRVADEYLGRTLKAQAGR